MEETLVAGIMNAKYVNGMPLARQERESGRGEGILDRRSEEQVCNGIFAG